ncbi:hypothetical protein J6590_092807 [Homalodisca vitripennis]|nr:hypothetical protein J6590_092807 [Homalodisca vitripennis]
MMLTAALVSRHQQLCSVRDQLHKKTSHHAPEISEWQQIRFQSLTPQLLLIYGHVKAYPFK